MYARTGKITFKNQDFRRIETLTSPPVEINLRKTTKALWFNTKEYKPIGFKTKMLKNFDDFLDDAFKSMKSDEKLIIKDFSTWSKHFHPIKKYSTLHTGIQDQLEYCLLLADKDQKVEQSCLQTIFNSDFFWE